MPFNPDFRALTGFDPLSWQTRLYDAHFAEGDLPSAVDIPTGLGKTMVMALWLIAWARGAKLPRRLVYVVDRRVVVDQATQEAEKLALALEKKDDPSVVDLRKELEKRGLEKSLPISTLRGQHVDNRAWLENPASPAIVIGTVDMVGSRLLFGGYGVSRKMRPYHAGLLGVDTLVVLDEAHLVPPFAHFLKAIEIEQDAAFWPKDAEDRKLLPRFALLPLSATQRDLGVATDERASFRLEDGDRKDREVKKRLDANKRLELREFDDGDLDAQMARAAWELATEDGPARVAVFCDRREKSDEGKGPSAMGVFDKLANGDRKEERPAVDHDCLELLIGGRRARERETAAEKLGRLGFIGDKAKLEEPTFVIATSAAEVGVDLDADHMVCDLVAWERMAQRLGRVNRRGSRQSARVIVFWKEPAAAKKANELSAQEQRALFAFNAKAVLEALPEADNARDASPGALRKLAERARSDDRLKRLINDATTREPLRPALSRPLVDAWSMTSLDAHTGRPEIEPWLRGWEEDEKPQTTVVWRTHLPVRVDSEGRMLSPENYKKEIAEFFEAAPPHESEKLETETFRVLDWLGKRAAAVKNAKLGGSRDQDVGEREERAESEETGETPTPQKTHDDAIVALTFSPRGDFEKGYSLARLLEKRDGDAKRRFEAEFYGKTVVADARLGGIVSGVGLLDDKADAVVPAADSDKKWSKAAKFRVRDIGANDNSDAQGPDDRDDWRFEIEFVLSCTPEGEPKRRLVVEHLKEAANSEDARAVSCPQALTEHQKWVKDKALRIVERVGLDGDYAKALAIAARLHDEGKKADRWQRAFNAAWDCKKFRIEGPLAKTRGPINQSLFDGYRHEFGSLRHVEQDGEFQSLPDDLKDLVLHLVAAHHGGARPVIETRGCEDAPPSALEARARDVALRFARLQRRWGPWGLAWWEALLRAADQQASRENDEKGKSHGAG